MSAMYFKCTNDWIMFWCLSLNVRGPCWVKESAKLLLRHMYNVTVRSSNPWPSSPTIWQTWNQSSNQAEQHLPKTVVDSWRLLSLQIRNQGSTSETHVELLLTILISNCINNCFLFKLYFGCFCLAWYCILLYNLQVICPSFAIN